MKRNRGKVNYIIEDRTTNKRHLYFVIQDMYVLPHTLFKGHDISIFRADTEEDVTDLFIRTKIQ